MWVARGLLLAETVQVDHYIRRGAYQVRLLRMKILLRDSTSITTEFNISDYIVSEMLFQAIFHCIASLAFNMRKIKLDIIEILKRAFNLFLAHSAAVNLDFDASKELLYN
jgi:hypothetical protein